MDYIFGALYLVVAISAFWGICFIKNSNKMKREGQLISGKKLSDAIMPGRPIRYIVEVEYVIDNITNKRKITTTDKNIMQCKNSEQISLVYVEKNKKVYWAEEQTKEDLVKVILLSFICGFALLLGIYTFCKNLVV